MLRTVGIVGCLVLVAGRDMGEHPDQDGTRSVGVDIAGDAHRVGLGVGPTAHFLDNSNNVQLSCSVCKLAFDRFYEALDKKRKELKEISRDHVSEHVQTAMAKACTDLRGSHRMKWVKDGDRPHDYALHPKDSVPSHHEGTKKQLEWTDQFIQHRCEWLREKYSLEIAIKFAEKELPRPSCPITECREKGADEKKANK
eukprot:TRINITY_DN43961_c0_g1_i1.p1 TRINITY_DN43961_c0_g1~~TRINITY_DN43961_c0_g1_i1.p1  ORF type:complete len:198 (+),score=44.51 TRINITY_DN43961_c0_g1_i1:418-1011(+)